LITNESEIILSDVYQTILAYQSVLHTRPLQIYYSALVTMPSCTLLQSVQARLPQGLPLLVSARAPNWHTTSHELLRGHDEPVTSIAFASDSSCFISGSFDRTVRLWKTSDKTQIRVFKGHTGAVLSVACPSPLQLESDLLDSLPFFVSGSEDKTIRLWDPTGHKEPVLFEGHDCPVLSVAILDVSQIASGSADHTVRLWSIASGQRLAVLEGHTSEVSSVVFTMDARIVSGSYDKTIRLWDTISLQQLRVFEGHSGSVRSVALTSGVPQMIISGSDDWTVRAFNIDSPDTTTIMHGHAGTVLSVASSLLGDHVVSSSEDMTVRIWNVASGEQRAVLEEQAGIRGVKVSAVFESDEAVIAGSGNDLVRLWDDNGIGLPSPRIGIETKPDMHAGAVLCVMFSLDGLWIASGSDDQTGRIWDTRSGRQLAILKGHQGWVYSIDFSPDNKRVLTASVDKTVRIWATGTWEQELVLESNPNPMSHVKFAPDGVHVMVRSGDDILAWNITGRYQLCVILIASELTTICRERNAYMSNYKHVQRFDHSAERGCEHGMVHFRQCLDHLANRRRIDCADLLVTC
jgi:WD40 repeat protein